MSNKNDDDKHIVRGGGPCGACRYLRRKCVKTCIFAPYFESDSLGTSHFAALHKVFGASNASKLLLTIPSDKRPDAVVSLCYEALSRVSDPVYGCISHILILQQQVENLQAELSYVQAQLSILQCSPFPAPPLHLVDHQSSREDITKLRQLDDPSELDQTLSFQLSSINNSREDIDTHNDDLQRFARELVDNYFPGIKFHSTS